jgi:hypothetical protein
MQSDIGNQPSIRKSNRRGWLRHGNPPGDFTTASRCGGRTRAGTSCKAPAMGERPLSLAWRQEHKAASIAREVASGARHVASGMFVFQVLPVAWVGKKAKASTAAMKS